MRIFIKLYSILQILFIIFVSTSSLEAETLFESFGVGLPAINVSDTPEGETTYSLSLQILALMTVLTGTRVTSAYFAALIGTVSEKSANYKPKLLTVNLNANASLQ